MLQFLRTCMVNVMYLLKGQRNRTEKYIKIYAYMLGLIEEIKWAWRKILPGLHVPCSPRHKTQGLARCLSEKYMNVRDWMLCLGNLPIHHSHYKFCYDLFSSCFCTDHVHSSGQHLAWQQVGFLNNIQYFNIHWGSVLFEIFTYFSIRVSNNFWHFLMMRLDQVSWARVT